MKIVVGYKAQHRIFADCDKVFTSDVEFLDVVGIVFGNDDWGRPNFTIYTKGLPIGEETDVDGILEGSYPVCNVEYIKFEAKSPSTVVILAKTQQYTAFPGHIESKIMEHDFASAEGITFYEDIFHVPRLAIHTNGVDPSKKSFQLHSAKYIRFVEE